MVDRQCFSIAYWWKKIGWDFIIYGGFLFVFLLIVLRVLYGIFPTRLRFLDQLFAKSEGKDVYSSLQDQQVHDTSLILGNMAANFLSPQKPVNNIYAPKLKKRYKPTESKGETTCRLFLEYYFKKAFPKVRPSFLKNPITSENLELDMYNEELKLACEYHGAQHFHFNEFLHGRSKEKFQNQQYRDLMKRDLCQKQGILLIEVPYTVLEEDIPSFLAEELEKNGFSPKE